MVTRLLRRRGVPTFVLLAVLVEVAGRSLTARVDRALHVAPLAPSGADYYPVLLVAVKVLAALALAGLLARAVRARAAADAGERLLHAVGRGDQCRTPRLRPGLSPRVWLASFAATSVLYLFHMDTEGAVAGRWPLLSPWLHTYALPVFAVLSVLVAVAWRFAGWLHAVEEYAERTLARARRLLVGAVRTALRHARPGDDRAPRRRFGLALQSRPPPLPA